MSDITPNPHFLESIRADRGSYLALLAEGIDNAFDADATEIKLSLNRDFIEFQDNGVGITKKRELYIIKLGEHGPMPSTSLGKFGIGLKYQAVNAGNIIEVNSVSIDGRMSLIVDWEEVIKQGKWIVPDPLWLPSNGDKTGTNIRISSIRFKPPTVKDLKVIHEKLSQMFYPALAAGRIIVLNDDRLSVLSEPEMIDIVEGDVRLPGGKGAHVRGGIMVNPDASPTLFQVQVSYKHRVIISNSRFGCGDFSGLRKMFARIELNGKLKLGRFKDELVDIEQDEIEEGVQKILRPILQKCRSAEMSAIVDDMTGRINAMLPPELKPLSRRQRKKKPRIKKVLPENSDRKEHPKRPHKPPSGSELLIAFDKPLAEIYGYGRFEQGKPNRITLAEDNPIIARYLENRDKKNGAESLLSYALLIYEGWQLQSGRLEMLNMNGSFGLKAWQMMKFQKLPSED